MTTEQKQQVKAKLNRYVSLPGNSQAKAATQMDVAPATLSAIRNDKWESISGEMWAKVEGFLNAQGHTDMELLRTGTFETITNMCAFAQNACSMRFVVGASGIGKTTALKAYCSENPNAYYVLCNEAMTKSELLARIARVMGIQIGFQTPFGYISRIAEHINARPGSLLVMDDFGKLNDRKMHVAQMLYDECEGRLGLVCSGLPYLYDNLSAGAQKGKMGYPELLRRAGLNRERLELPSPAERKALAKQLGITEEKALNWVAKRCNNLGTIAQLAKDMQLVQEPVTEDLLESLFPKNA